MTADILSADLLLRVGVDASGAAAEVTSRLTAAERAAAASGDRIAAGISKGADKATVAQLRVVAATERLNTVLKKESATAGQRASAQASLITAQQRFNAELSKSETAVTRVATAEKKRFGFLKSTLAAGAGFAGAQGLFNLVKQSRDAAVELQDVVSANSSVFGKAATDIDRFVKARGDALNLDRLTVQQLAAGFGTVFKGAGLDPQQAVNQALTLTERAADVRSLRGGTLEDVSGAFRSALVGETEPIRRYGVLLNDASLKLRALNDGLISSTKETLPPAIKAQVAYEEILAQTVDAQGDIARTTDSAANKVEDQREKMANLRQEIGTGLLPLYGELLGVGSDLAPVLVEVAKGFSAVLSNDIARKASEITLLAVAASKLGGALNNFVGRTTEKIAANVRLAGSYEAVAVAASEAAGAEVLASRAGTPGAAVAGRAGRFGGRGQLGALGALTLLGAGSGALGGGAGADVANVLGATATGAYLGSLFPGPGTLIGAGIGAAAGIGLNILGPDQGVSTSRTPKQIQADIARTTARLDALRASDNPSSIEGTRLQGRLGDLSKELAAARTQAKQTFQVFDEGTGTFKRLTQSQAEAAAAAGQHAKELEEERKRHEELIAQFAVDPISGTPDKSKALNPTDILSKARATSDARLDLRGDFRRLARAGATRETLEKLYDLEAQAPGTVDKIAGKGAKKFVRAFQRELREQHDIQEAFTRTFESAVTEADRAGQRASRAFKQAFESNTLEIDILTNFKQGTYVPTSGGKATRTSTKTSVTPATDSRIARQTGGWPQP